MQSSPLLAAARASSMITVFTKRVLCGGFILIASCISTAAADTSAAPTRTYKPDMVDVLTQRYNNGRTGSNIAEHVLTVASLQGGQFQRLYHVEVEGQIYAQPLVAHVRSSTGVVTNILVIATMKNNLYAFAVDDALYGGASKPHVLWSKNLGPPVPSNFMSMRYSSYICDLFKVIGCLPRKKPPKQPLLLPPIPMNGEDIIKRRFGLYNINPNIGILSTPVIDPALRRIFVAFKTRGADGIKNMLEARDLLTGEQIASTVLGSEAGVGSTSSDGKQRMPAFNQSTQMQRPALLLSNGSIYVAFGSHQDTPPWHGWIFRYDESSLKLTSLWCSTPNAMGGSIWQAGSGLAADQDGDIYAMTGNGEGTTGAARSIGADLNNYAEMFVQLAPDLTPVAHYFPKDGRTRDGQDLDVGSSGPVLMPGFNVLIGGEKEGKIFVLDTKRQLLDRQIFQASSHTTPIANFHVHGSPAVWRSAKLGLTAYFWPERDVLRAYRWDDVKGQFDCAQQDKGCSQSTAPTKPDMSSTIKTAPCLACMPGGIVSISSDGDLDGTGIVWATSPHPQLRSSLISAPVGGGGSNVVLGILYAFDAENLKQELWNSAKNAQPDAAFYYAKFNPPVVADGRVYLATFSDRLDIFGLREWAKFVAQSPVPPALDPGTHFIVRATFLNAGITTWDTSSYSLGALNPNQNNWLPQHVNLPADVHPGDEVTVDIPLAAPTTPGDYAFQWGLRRGNDSFGEPTPSLHFTIGNPAAAR